MSWQKVSQRPRAAPTPPRGLHPPAGRQSRHTRGDRLTWIKIGVEMHPYVYSVTSNEVSEEGLADTEAFLSKERSRNHNSFHHFLPSHGLRRPAKEGLPTIRSRVTAAGTEREGEGPSGSGASAVN